MVEKGRRLLHQLRPAEEHRLGRGLAGRSGEGRRARREDPVGRESSVGYQRPVPGDRAGAGGAPRTRGSGAGAAGDRRPPQHQQRPRRHGARPRRRQRPLQHHPHLGDCPPAGVLDGDGSAGADTRRAERPAPVHAPAAARRHPGRRSPVRRRPPSPLHRRRQRRPVRRGAAKGRRQPQSGGRRRPDAPALRIRSERRRVRVRAVGRRGGPQGQRPRRARPSRRGHLRVRARRAAARALPRAPPAGGRLGRAPRRRPLTPRNRASSDGHARRSTARGGCG